MAEQGRPRIFERSPAVCIESRDSLTGRASPEQDQAGLRKSSAPLLNPFTGHLFYQVEGNETWKMRLNHPTCSWLFLNGHMPNDLHSKQVQGNPKGPDAIK